MKHIPDHDERSREFPDGTYWIPTGKEFSGRIVCYRKDLQLIDFYRTMEILVCAGKRHPVDGTSGVDKPEVKAVSSHAGSTPATGAMENMKNNQ